MVLSHLANRLGLWDYIAPPKMKTSEQKLQESEDLQIAKKIQQEEQVKYQRIKTQYELEQKAMSNNQYAKRQRVKYYSKVDDIYVDAVVVGVHFDDGPDRPYYTIKYTKVLQDSEEESYEKKIRTIEMEKQTNGDRLSRVPWDEDRTWTILNK